MMNHLLAAPGLLVALIVTPSVTLAQPASGPAGHWEGAVRVPGQEFKFEIDLTRAGEKWDGTIAIPAQNVKGFPLAAITVEGDTVSFAMNGVPGNPQFKGTVSKDGKSLSGEYSQRGRTVPFAVARTGDAKIEPPAKSTHVTKDLEGSWEGAVDRGDRRSRFSLKLSNRPDGVATGTLDVVSPAGVTEIPIVAVVQTGSHLLVQTVAGTYTGDLKDGQLAGTWTQGPETLPLVFKRPM